MTDLKPAGVGATLAGAVLYALAALAAGTALGVPRELFLAPRVTSDLAVVIEAPMMAGIVWLAARFIVRRLGVSGRAARLTMGVIALALVVGAENLMSWRLRGESVFAHWALFGYLAAAANLAGLVWFLFAPLSMRLQPRPSSAARRPLAEAA